ncbi:hypothetical protein P3T76_009677 [Phytophthora citrophthora]|uniref:Uncharacterized protein n=1 Tax=Phytophthora citrophthora TaxID=4793 RepID=A0AAD9LIS1_9STRA|nr:hypothetical protein P3T76_009677 [Phytophthora citrophthora]
MQGLSTLLQAIDLAASSAYQTLAAALRAMEAQAYARSRHSHRSRKTHRPFDVASVAAAQVALETAVGATATAAQAALIAAVLTATIQNEAEAASGDAAYVVAAFSQPWLQATSRTFDLLQVAIVASAQAQALVLEAFGGYVKR